MKHVVMGLVALALWMVLAWSHGYTQGHGDCPEPPAHQCQEARLRDQIAQMDVEILNLQAALKVALQQQISD